MLFQASRGTHGSRVPRFVSRLISYRLVLSRLDSSRVVSFLVPALFVSRLVSSIIVLSRLV